MNKSRAFFLLLLLLCASPSLVFAQTEGHRLGETIELVKNLRLRVTMVGAGTFAKVNLNGVAKVFELQFERDAGPIVALDASTDPANTGVSLIIGESRFAPMALGPKTGSDLEAVMVDKLAVSRESGRGQWISFGGQSTKVQWLFDIPKEFADKPAKLVLEVLVGLKPPPIRVEIAQ